MNVSEIIPIHADVRGVLRHRDEYIPKERFAQELSDICTERWNSRSPIRFSPEATQEYQLVAAGTFLTRDIYDALSSGISGTAQHPHVILRDLAKQYLGEKIAGHVHPNIMPANNSGKSHEEHIGRYIFSLVANERQHRLNVRGTGTFGKNPYAVDLV